MKIFSKLILNPKRFYSIAKSNITLFADLLFQNFDLLSFHRIWNEMLFYR